MENLFIIKKVNINKVMKTQYFFLVTTLCLLSARILFAQDLDSIKIIPSSPTDKDSIIIIAYSKGFSGDCTFLLITDSINEKKLYLSGKYNSNNKCGILTGVEDSLGLGKFPIGNYLIDLSVIDTHGTFPNKAYSIDFTVTEFTGIRNFNNKIKIYPNPCDNFINIKSLSGDINDLHIQLFNSIGQLEYEEYTGKQHEEIIIDMSIYKKGIYFLKVADNVAFGRMIVKE